MASGDPDKDSPDDQTIGPGDAKHDGDRTMGPDQTIGPGRPIDDPGQTPDPDQTIGPDQTKPDGATEKRRSLTGPGNDETVFGSSLDNREGKRKSLGQRNIQIDGYEILEELGRGGMGVVYKARDKALNRIVAIKMILAGAHAGDESIARFRIEAEAVAQLQHRGIVQVYDVGQADGQPYCALEFIEGGGLDELIATQKLSVYDSVDLVEELAHAMSSAHQSGIVHRDLKPANILLADSSGSSTSIDASSVGKYRPKITDFGLAKKVEQDSQHTRTGAIMGTPGYMAPEQARGAKRIGPTADIYSLGAILYQLVTDRPPFADETPIKTIMRVLNDPPASPRTLNKQVDRDLDTIILKCLEKEPRARYASAEHLAQDLHRYRLGMPIEARPVSTVERIGKWIRRKPWAASLIALSCIGLIGLIVGGIIFNRQLSTAYTKVDEQHNLAVKALESESKALAAESEALDAQSKALEETDAALRRAESSDIESRRRLIDNYVNNGLQTMNRNQMLPALPWLSESLALETDSRRREIHQLRFNLAVQNAPKPERTWLYNAAIGFCRFSDDGKLVASYSSDLIIRIHDVKSNKVIHQLTSPSQIISFDISPDFRQAALASVHINAATGNFLVGNVEVQTWDILSGKVSEPFQYQIPNNISSKDAALKFLPRFNIGERTVTFFNQADSRVDAIDLDSHELVKSFDIKFETETRDENYVWNEEGRSIALLSGKNLVVRSLDGSSDKLMDLKLDTDREIMFQFVKGNQLFVAADELRIYDIESGEILFEQPRAFDDKPEIAFGTETSVLAVVWPSGTLELFDESGSAIDKQTLDSRIMGSLFSDDGRTLIVVTRFEVIRFDALTGTQLGSPIPSTLKPLQFADLSPDGHSLVVASGLGLFRGSGCLRIWDIRESGSLTQLRTNQDATVSLAVESQSGKYVALRNELNGELEIHDVRDRLHPKRILSLCGSGTDKRSNQVQYATWSPSDQRIAVVGDGKVRVFQMPTGTEICRAAMEKPNGVIFSSDESKLAVRYGEKQELLAMVDANSGEILHEGLKHKRFIRSMKFVSGDTVLSTIAADLNFRAFDVETGERLEKSNLRMRPTSNYFDKQGKRVVVGGIRLGEMPGQVTVLDAVTGEPLIEPLDFDTEIIRVSISNNGQLIAIANANGIVTLIDSQKGVDSGIQMIHPDLITDIRFSRDDRILLTHCEDGRLRLFDVDSGLPVAAPIDSDTGTADEIRNARFLGKSYDICIRSDHAKILRLDNRKISAEHASALSRFLSGSVISERGIIVHAPARSLQKDFSNVTIREMMDAKMVPWLLNK